MALAFEAFHLKRGDRLAGERIQSAHGLRLALDDLRELAFVIFVFVKLAGFVTHGGNGL